RPCRFDDGEQRVASDRVLAELLVQRPVVARDLGRVAPLLPWAVLALPARRLLSRQASHPPALVVEGPRLVAGDLHSAERRTASKAGLARSKACFCSSVSHTRCSTVADLIGRQSGGATSAMLPVALGVDRRMKIPCSSDQKKPSR